MDSFGGANEFMPALVGMVDAHLLLRGWKTTNAIRAINLARALPGRSGRSPREEGTTQTGAGVEARGWSNDYSPV